jgi:tRNA threonylcarbamoyladenosine biosynthesis protein TsaE
VTADHGELLPPLAAAGHLALTQQELEDWGRRLGRQIDPPLLITLDGELGAGKTTLVRAICAGYGVRDEVTSPTFAIVHQYDAPKSAVYHVDLFRLETSAALQNIGWDDIVQSDALILVEWPRRAGDMLPEAHLPIELRHVPHDATRRVLYAGGHIGGRMKAGES